MAASGSSAGAALISLPVHAIAAGGDGVGRLADGMTVFVPRTAPGDVACVDLVERKRRYARGHLVELETPGHGRATPECPHYVTDDCGGCQLQHVTYETQLAAKRRIVGDAIRRIGKRAVDDPPIVPAAARWGYRSKITLSVSADRRRIGLHPYDDPQAVFDLTECRIASESLMDLWHRLRGRRALFPAAVRSVVLREDRAGGLHVILRGGEAPYDAGPLARAVGAAAITYWWEPEGGAVRAIAGERRGFPALAFAQVHQQLADRIRSDAVDALGPVAGRTVWDLFGGVGDTARLLAARGAHVWSVDRDRSATEWAQTRRSPEGAPAGSPHYVPALVEEVMHRLPEPDAVILNPPRRGAERRVTETLARWGRRGLGGRVIAYVSCDPATLARDLRNLEPFRLAAVTAYDLFPQTSHVETLAVLEGA